MRPYVIDKKIGDGKIIADLGRGTGVSKLSKLIARNANRGQKKAYRQYMKLILRRHVEDLPNEPIYEAEAILKEAEDDDFSKWEEKGLI